MTDSEPEPVRAIDGAPPLEVAELSELHKLLLRQQEELEAFNESQMGSPPVLTGEYTTMDDPGGDIAWPAIGDEHEMTVKPAGQKSDGPQEMPALNRILDHVGIPGRAFIPAGNTALPGMPTQYRPWKPQIPAIIGEGYNGPPVPPGTIGEDQDGDIYHVLPDGTWTRGWEDGKVYGVSHPPLRVVRWGRPGDVADTDAPLGTLAADIHRTAVEHGWWPGDETAGGSRWVRPQHRTQVDGQPWKPDAAKLERNIGETLMMVVTEVAEAMEDYRRSDGTIDGLARWTSSWDDASQTYKAAGFPLELADILVRVLDLMAALGIDADHVMHLVTSQNRARSHRHGGKLA